MKRLSLPVEPSRLQSLDVVRGVAVLGILLLNIVSFALPEAAYVNPNAYGGAHGADLVAWIVTFVLFDGKMRGLFSFLFGASMLLVIDRTEASGRKPAAVHQRRMVWLLGFGLAHLWLVWSGDILAQYAVVGMIAFAFRGLAVPRLIVLGTMLALLGFVVQLQLPLAVAQGEGIAQLARDFGVPPAAEIARELALYRGDYAGLVHHRFGDYPLGPVPLLVFYGPETLAYMLFGMAALRCGLLTGAWTRARYRRWWLVSWGIALPAYGALAMWLVHADFDLLAVTWAGMALTVPFRPVMVLGWACLILLLARPEGALTGRIAAAGRMAFTNYLATSLVCTTLFYGYGFGWFGHLSRWQLYPVVTVIWALLLLWSKPWLAHFRFGPFEWAWRSLSRGALQPMRRTAAIASQ